MTATRRIELWQSPDDCLHAGRSCSGANVEPTETRKLIFTGNFKSAGVLQGARSNGRVCRCAQLAVARFLDREVQGWEVLHEAAMLVPNNTERPLVNLLGIIEQMVMRFTDPVLREGVAELIEGTTTLLNGEWGPRLHMDAVDEVLGRLAGQIGYDRDMRRFKEG